MLTRKAAEIRKRRLHRRSSLQWRRHLGEALSPLHAGNQNLPATRRQAGGVVLQAGGHAGVLWPEGLLQENQRLLLMRLGLGVSPCTWNGSAGCWAGRRYSGGRAELARSNSRLPPQKEWRLKAIRSPFAGWIGAPLVGFRSCRAVPSLLDRARSQPFDTPSISPLKNNFWANMKAMRPGVTTMT